MRVTQKSFPIVVLAVLLLTGCAGEKNKFELDDLKGCWYDANKNVYEEWKEVGKKHLSGKGFEVKGTDTTVFEILELKEINGTLTFLADVEQVMGQGIIDFPLANRTHNGLVFINQEHDYPQVLFYEKISADSLKVTVGKFPLIEDKNPMVLNYVRKK